MSSKKVSDLMTNQKLLSNKDLMIKNLDNLVDNLSECEDYIQLVIVSFHLNRNALNRMERHLPMPTLLKH